MREYKLDNGWIVSKKAAQSAILHVLPIPNSLFRKEQFVEIPDAIFRDIELGEIRVKDPNSARLSATETRATLMTLSNG